MDTPARKTYGCSLSGKQRDFPLLPTAGDMGKRDTAGKRAWMVLIRDVIKWGNPGRRMGTSGRDQCRTRRRSSSHKTRLVLTHACHGVVKGAGSQEREKRLSEHLDPSSLLERGVPRRLQGPPGGGRVSHGPGLWGSQP